MLMHFERAQKPDDGCNSQFLNRTALQVSTRNSFGRIPAPTPPELQISTARCPACCWPLHGIGWLPCCRSGAWQIRQKTRMQRCRCNWEVPMPPLPWRLWPTRRRTRIIEGEELNHFFRCFSTLLRFLVVILGTTRMVVYLKHQHRIETCRLFQHTFAMVA